MSNGKYNNFSLIMILALVFTSVSSLMAIGNDLITNKLADRLSTATDGELIKINISMKEQADYEALIIATSELKNKQERREFVNSELKNLSFSTQEGVMNLLTSNKLEGNVEDINSLWIVNLINCFATLEVIEQLSLRDDIRSIDYDKLTEGVIIENIGQSISVDHSKDKSKDREITWNVTQVNADDVWGLGYDGTDVIVSVIDTGVNYNHQDIADHVWDGGTAYPNHGYDYANNDNDPMDDHGHGTHCSGTVAGDGTAGSQTGIAPGATIMCLKVLTSGGSGYESAVWSAIEFSVDNGAHVLSLSLGWPQDSNPNNPAWRDAFNNTLAAGVVAAVAAGNERGNYPAPDDCRTPGTVPPPWTNPDQTLTGGNSAVVCIGATTSTDAMANFSSTGPSSWEGEAGYDDYHFNPEMGLLRPDLSAPGANIKSLAHYSNTGYEDGWSGTSMATPLVAGVMALMLNKSPNLTPAEISQILEENVYHVQTPKNNDYGTGIVDALASVNAAVSNGFPSCQITSPSHGVFVLPETVVTVTVEASDETRSVARVDLYIDDTLLSSDVSAPYSFDWNTNGETIGAHEVKAIAVDDENNETERSITVNINYAMAYFFLEDFETTTSWTLTGEFEIDAPQGLGGEYGNSDPSSAVSGTKVLGVDLTGLGANPGDYEASLTDRAYTAESPVIDCVDYQDVTIEFQRYLNVEQPSYDHAYIDVWDGSGWNEVYSNNGGVEDATWVVTEINISEFADGNQIKVRFSIGASDGAWQYSGWNIDDFKLKGRAPSGIENNYELAITNFELKQNYPNPFNPVTKINYELRITNYESAAIVVYNSKGEQVWDKSLVLGSSSIDFDGSKFNSGVYYYSLLLDGKNVETKSMVLIK